MRSPSPRPFRHPLAAALLIAAAAGCGDPGEAPGTDGPEPPARTPEPLPPDRPTGSAGAAPEAPRYPPLDAGPLPGDTWEPPPGLMNEAAAMGAAMDMEQAIEDLYELPEARRLDVLRAGLRLPDPRVASACAGALHPDELDLWESGRAAELLLPEIGGEGTDVHPHNVGLLLGSAQLAAALGVLADDPPERNMSDLLDRYHGRYGRAQIDALCRLVAGPKGPLEEAALAMLGEALKHTDARREEVAAALLGPGAFAEASAMDTGGGGISSVLRAVIHEVSFSRETDEMAEAGFLSWAIRWLLKVEVRQSDAEFLLEKLEELGDQADVFEDSDEILHARNAVLWCLRNTSDEASGEALLDQMREHSEAGTFAMAALAVRGDEVALDALATDAVYDPQALALLLVADPARANASVRARVLGPDESVAYLTLEALHEAKRYRDLYRLPWPADPFAGLAADALAADPPLSGRRLAQIAVSVPGCRTRPMARAAIDALAKEPRIALRAYADSPHPFESYPVDEVLRLFEVAEPEAFVGLLRQWAELEDDPGRDIVLQWLILLGDDDSHREIAAWWRRNPVRDRYFLPDDTAWLALGEVRGPAVKKLLEERSGSDDDEADAATAALAVFHGLSPHAADVVWGAAEGDGDLAQTVRRHVRAGRPDDAVAAVIADDPDEQYGNGVGFVRDPRVRSYLKRLRRKRELGNYAWATAQLAISGDAAARAETWAAIRDGREGWVRQLELPAVTLGFDPATFPFWAGLEQGAPEQAVPEAYEVLVGLLMDDPTPGSPGTGETPRESFHRVWSGCGGRLVYSRIARAFVPAPADAPR